MRVYRVNSIENARPDDPAMQEVPGVDNLTIHMLDELESNSVEFRDCTPTDSYPFYTVEFRDTENRRIRLFLDPGVFSRLKRAVNTSR